MDIPGRSWKPIGDDRYGGQAAVSQCIFNGRRVAVKIPYLSLINLDSILRVSISSTHNSQGFKRVNCRDFAERQLLGNTSGIPISCLCLV